jgi:quinol monooxygenase YgiN
MIYVLATIHLEPGQQEAFLREFRLLIPQVRAEQGCLEYSPAIETATDLPAQAPPQADVIVVVEKWTDVPALTAHLQAPHMTAYRQRVAGLVRRVELRVLEPA